MKKPALAFLFKKRKESQGNGYGQGVQELPIRGGQKAQNHSELHRDFTGFLRYLKDTNLRLQGTLRRSHITEYKNSLLDRDYVYCPHQQEENSLQYFNCYLIRCGSMRDIKVYPLSRHDFENHNDISLT